ncbi:hypothetical protein [Streptomyces albidoflavus]|uniref:hypothetical protein n=1 Tax=Streptomyces albidoflavus TaxID=1886 RepID=UPI00211C7D09|nr:hypothetical protein [Streptomyces albidoflavus]
MNRTHQGPPGRPSAQGGGPGATAEPAASDQAGSGLRATMLRAGRWAFTAPLRLLCTTLARLLSPSDAPAERISFALAHRRLLKQSTTREINLSTT